MEVRWIRRGDVQYPVQLVQRMGGAAPAAIAVAGDTNILRHPRVGLICSIQLPGSVIIKTFDVVRKIRDAHVAVIGGFHSPMEKECLDLLLRGAQPVVLCPARSLRRLRIGQAARRALAEGRLLVLSRFGDEVRRTTSVQAMQRNDLVAALSEVILVPHASPDGKTWDTVRRALERGQKVFSLDDEANTRLLACGAKACHSDNLDELISSTLHLQSGINSPCGSAHTGDSLQWEEKIPWKEMPPFALPNRPGQSLQQPFFAEIS